MIEERNNLIKALVWTIGAVIFAFLTYRVLIQEKYLDCDMCTVELVNVLAGREPYPFGEFNIRDLFVEYRDADICTVTWSQTGGYSYG